MVICFINIPSRKEEEGENIVVERRKREGEKQGRKRGQNNVKEKRKKTI